jgi:hypothetical protein
MEAGKCMPISLRWQSSDNGALSVYGSADFVENASAVLRQNLSSLHNGVHVARQREEEDHMMPISHSSQQWTREKPTVPGWYWIRTNASYEIVRVIVSDAGHPGMSALLVPIEPGGQGETLDLKEMDVEWHGPMSIPAVSSISAAA